MTLIHLFLMIINVEHLFLTMLVLCLSSLEKCLFRASAPTFLLKLFVSFCFPIELYYIFGFDPLSDIWFANIFSRSMSCLSVLLMVSFAVQKLVVWCSSTCSFWLFLSLLQVSYPKDHHQDHHQVYALCFFQGVLWFLALICKSLIHFELIFLV